MFKPKYTKNIIHGSGNNQKVLIIIIVFLKTYMKNDKCSKPILQNDINRKYLRGLTGGILSSNISNCCSGRYKAVGRFRGKYKDKKMLKNSKYALWYHISLLVINKNYIHVLI